jgi:putative flippase GtrA
LKFSKPFFTRLILFLVGGVLSIGVNAGLFELFHTYFGWNRFVAYALSLAIINVLLFLWNYCVGFRTTRHWGDSAWRHVVCLSVTNGLNYGLVMLFQGILPDWKTAVIAVVQVFIAFFKFGLYHYWVYPREEHAPPAKGVEPAPDVPAQ